jgi:hypothetical protein
MDIKQDYQTMEALRRSAQEICQHARQTCEEAASAKERARERMRVCLRARQLRREARELIPC